MVVQRWGIIFSLSADVLHCQSNNTNALQRRKQTIAKIIECCAMFFTPFAKISDFRFQKIYKIGDKLMTKIWMKMTLRLNESYWGYAPKEYVKSLVVTISEHCKKSSFKNTSCKRLEYLVAQIFHRKTPNLCWWLQPIGPFVAVAKPLLLQTWQSLHLTPGPANFDIINRKECSLICCICKVCAAKS